MYESISGLQQWVVFMVNMVLKSGKKSYFFFPLFIFMTSFLFWLFLAFTVNNYILMGYLNYFFVVITPIISLLPFFVNNKKSNIKNFKYYISSFFLSMLMIQIGWMIFFFFILPSPHLSY